MRKAKNMPKKMRLMTLLVTEIQIYQKGRKSKRVNQFPLFSFSKKRTKKGRKRQGRENSMEVPLPSNITTIEQLSLQGQTFYKFRRPEND